MKKLIPYCLIVILLSCNSEKPVNQDGNLTSTDRSIVKKVNAIFPKSETFQQQIISNGKIEALQKSELRFKSGDRIVRINVKNGDFVVKGKLLANLDNALLLNSIEKAKIDLEQAENKLVQEKINYGISDVKDSEIDSVILKNLKFKSGLQEAKNKLENAQMLYDQTVLRAPFSGLVANLDTKEGNYITTNDIFCAIISQDKLEVTFNILESELSYVSKNQKISLTSFSKDSETHIGKVTEINPLVDNNGFIKVKARLDSKSKMLFDGMNTKVILNNPIKNALIVPKEALVLRSNKQVVFTIEDNKAHWNYVEIIAENATHYALKEGSINTDNMIIISGNLNLSHDAPVAATVLELNP
jgi:RND family efflux transporter MFP subunit